jgi:hypothetical protein
MEYKNGGTQMKQIEKDYLLAILNLKIQSCKNFLSRTDSGKYCVRRETATRQAIVLDLATILAEMKVISWERWEEIGRLIELCDNENCDSTNCNSYIDGKCKYYIESEEPK